MPCTRIQLGICGAPPLCSLEVHVALPSAAPGVAPPNVAAHTRVVSYLPPVASFALAAPQPRITTSSEVLFAVNFSSAVAGLTAEVFQVHTRAIVTSTTLTGSGTTYALTVTVGAPPTLVCPLGYTYAIHNGSEHCFRLTATVGWSEAEAACAPYHLASIASGAFDAALAHFVSSGVVWYAGSSYIASRVRTLLAEWRWVCVQDWVARLSFNYVVCLE